MDNFRLSSLVRGYNMFLDKINYLPLRDNNKFHKCNCDQLLNVYY